MQIQATKAWDPEAFSFAVVSCSQEETEALGRAIGSLLEPGDVVTLSGELGGGKTCLVRGIVSSVAPDSAALVSSPTFALLHEYPGQPAVLHYDCYRLHGIDDAFEAGLEDQLQGNAVYLIEWPDKISEIIKNERLELLFEYDGETSRRISFLPHGPRAIAQVKKLSSWCFAPSF